MRIYYAFLMLILAGQISLAQTKSPDKKLHYGAKTSDKPTPDLIGLITVTPGIIRGTTSITVIIDVIETKKVPTSGLITVFVQKNNSFVDFEFNPTATSIENSKIQNANWSFDKTANPNYYIFTSTNVITGGAVSTIGLTGSFTTSDSGKLGLSMSILKGSGGELNSSNNFASTSISYSP